jgi:hypothetical protein
MARDWRLPILVPAAAAALLAFAYATEVTAAGKAADSKDGSASDQTGAGTGKVPVKKKRDPTEAQHAVDNAQKLLESGKAEQAVQLLTSTLSSGNLPSAIMAKALLYRGIAYRQQKKPAQAIADFTSALWLKGGLSDADRADGLRQRAAAYQEAGLSEGGEMQPAAAPKEGRARERTVSGTNATGWGAGTTTSPPPPPALAQEQASSPSSSGGGWDLISSLFSGSGFGGGSAQASSPAPEPAPASHPPNTLAILNGEQPATERRAPTPRPPQTSGWSQQTEVRNSRPAAVETASIGKPSGHFHIQIAAVRTPTEAKALASKIKREHAALLASREPEIDETVMGNMGAFYRVRIGPFATQQETHGVCAKLKASGLDCLVTTQ